MTEITLEEAIAEATNFAPWDQSEFELDTIGFKPAIRNAIATILQAVASGDLTLRTDADLAVALAYQRAAGRIEANPQPCSPAYPDAWTDAQIAYYESGQLDAATSFQAAILALAPAEPLAEVQALKADLQRFRDERTYVIGAIDGWDAAVEQGEVSTAVDSALVRFWKRLTERHLDRAEAAEAEVARLRAATDDWDGLWAEARIEAMKAMRKFPQPNYVISKIAEEAGEVVKAAIHCAEGRETAENVRGEMRQTIAMLYRLWVEGDQVHGLPPVRAALATPEKDAAP